MTQTHPEPTPAVPAEAQQSATVRAHYDHVAAEYDALETQFERGPYSRWRRRLWSQVRGPQVLEVGVGTGKNIPYYPEASTVTAIDFSPGMLARAGRRAAALHASVELRAMDAEHLTFPDHTFDTVIATFVFGSVPDPVCALREVGRVVKPGGQVLLLEYVRPAGVLGTLVDVLNPLVFRVYGATINRHTAENVRQAGLIIDDIQPFWRGMVQMITAQSTDDRVSVANTAPVATTPNHRGGGADRA